MSARPLTESNRAALVAVVLWLGEGRFVETLTGDPHYDAVMAYCADVPGTGRLVGRNYLAEFLRWLDAGERLRLVGPKNPHGLNVEAYLSDYGTPQLAAESLVAIWESGE